MHSESLPLDRLTLLLSIIGRDCGSLRACLCEACLLSTEQTTDPGRTESSMRNSADNLAESIAASVCRQENVEVMLSNIDKTEVLENKSAELAAQAKTCEG
mmetsp:Transcript_21197/g.41351  ORF Transcript_21197/g.41351 Transcript_21197/m.41351 type:complete len:101 (-) Transcript_21197:13-315(-)